MEKSENFSSGAAAGEFFRTESSTTRLCFVSLFGQRNEKTLRLEQKLFERSEFFLFSVEKYWSRQKSAAGEFFRTESSTTRLCFVSLFGQRNEEPSRLEREQSVQALAAIEQQRSVKAQRQLS